MQLRPDQSDAVHDFGVIRRMSDGGCVWLDISKVSSASVRISGGLSG